MVDAAADRALADEAVELARQLLVVSRRAETRRERRRRRRFGALVAAPSSRALIFDMTDRVLRIDRRRTAATTFRHLVRQHGTRAFGATDTVLLRAAALVAPVAPRLVMPLVERRIRRETRGMVIPAEDRALASHLAHRRAEGFSLNVNGLGEAVLSDAEADRRLAAVLAAIRRPDVDYVSVKISAVVANIDVLAFDDSVERIMAALRQVFEAASAHATFVNLDMEEYRDLDLTIAAFTGLLDSPDLIGVDAGIVLQAYLPDAHDAAERLMRWAHGRRLLHPDSGRLRIRLVKGANLAMEEVDGELHGWTPAPYATKVEVDTSYKRLLDTLMRPEYADVIDVGVASHNLFDVAWALLRAQRFDAADRVAFEMLEGMAPGQARAVHERVSELRMYSPVVAESDFVAAIAYLTRRLDENTQPDNFLRAMFELTADDAEFERQATMFRASVDGLTSLDTTRRRARRSRSEIGFDNEPDTDFTDVESRDTVLAAMHDVGTHPNGCRVGRVPEPLTTVAEADSVLAAAMRAAAAPVSSEQRTGWLVATADVMREARVSTLALMAAETGKTSHEGDPEVSEAIDFCEFYAHDGIGRLRALERDGFAVKGRGVVCVVAPWNFPYAIPAGGVAAALAAGNAVVLKPAPEAVAVGALVAEHFWRGGVPRDRLQLVVCGDDDVGERLVTHPRVDTVVLTGSLATASLFLDLAPARRVLAETSGKNALVVTRSADLDLAIADIVGSAFGHAGQKCSAASLAIVDRAVHDSATFLPRLRDAVTSLRVGPASEPTTMMGPLVAPPTGPLLRALTTLDDGESWLVAPRPLDDSDPRRARSWTPGVRVGVRPGSWFHRTECFGPVLGVLRADDLDHAIELQNATPFGLTGGIHALDPSEVARWKAAVEVGNAYVNRHTTGALVRRQPFGGWKSSRVGGGAKAGGPGYTLQFARVRDRAEHLADAELLLDRADRSYRREWEAEFSRLHDPSGLRAESNVLRYVPLRTVAVRHDGSDPLGLDLLRLAADVTGVELVESDARSEVDAAFATRVRDVGRVRLLTSLADEARRVLHLHNVPIDDDPPVSAGDVELRRWVVEQSISETLHRHGRLPDRAH